MATRKITLALLERKGACITERDLFSAMYPHGVVPTPDECERVHDKLSFCWAADELLGPRRGDKYNTLYERANWQYHTEIGPFEQKRSVALAPLYEAFGKVRDPLLAQHYERCEDLRREYNNLEVGADWDQYSAKCGEWYREYLAKIRTAADLLDLLVEPVEQQYRVDIADAFRKRSITIARAFGEAWCT